MGLTGGSKGDENASIISSNPGMVKGRSSRSSKSPFGKGPFLPMRDALGGTYLSEEEPITNSRTDDQSCIDPSCDSIEFEAHRSELHCVTCGLSKGSGDMDPGFAPSQL